MRTLARALTALAAGLAALSMLAMPASAQQEGFSVNTAAVITGGGSGLRVTGTYDCPGSGQAHIIIHAGLAREQRTVACTDGYPASWWVIAAAPAGPWQPGTAGFYATFTTPAGQSEETGTLTIT